MKDVLTEQEPTQYFHRSGVKWHVITCEYPPQQGGVSDYTHLIANGLAGAGDEIHVWHPSAMSSKTAAGSATADVPGVIVHPEFGRFKPDDLRRVGDLLDRFSAPRRLLVQWVPHGYGYRSMNLPFCLWLRQRAVTHHDVIELMVHEPYLAFAEGSWKQNGVAAVHRLMTMVLLNAVRRVWMSIPAWEQYLRPYALGRPVPFRWLPVASNVPVVDDPAGVHSIQTKYAAEGRQLVGHFGTYDRHIAELLLRAVPLLLQSSKCHVLLMGRGSEVMSDQLTARHPELANLLHATGALDAADLSLHLRACDVMLQPYIDGVSSRRGSTMAALAHGVPVITTSGRLTEPLWAESEAVALVPVKDVTALVEATKRLLPDAAVRSSMSRAGRALYDEHFDIKVIVARLRQDANTVAQHGEATASS